MPNRLLTFARLAYEVAQRSLPERAHRFAPKRYTQPQLLACLLLKEYLGLDYRTAQETIELSDGLREALGLDSVPDRTNLFHLPARSPVGTNRRGRSTLSYFGYAGEGFFAFLCSSREGSPASNKRGLISTNPLSCHEHTFDTTSYALRSNDFRISIHLVLCGSGFSAAC